MPTRPNFVEVKAFYVLAWFSFLVLLPYLVLLAKVGSCWNSLLVWILCFFSSLTLVFSSLIMMCLGVDFLVFIMFDILLSLLAVSSHFFLQIFFNNTLFFFSVLDSSYTNVRSFVAIQVSDTLISPCTVFFSFCYLNWLVSLFFWFHCLLHSAIAFFSQFFISVILFSNSKVLIWLSLYFLCTLPITFCLAILRVFKFGDCSFEHFYNRFYLLVR